MKISDNSSPKAVFEAHSACTFVQRSEKEGKLIFFSEVQKYLHFLRGQIVLFVSFERMNCIVFT